MSACEAIDAGLLVLRPELAVWAPLSRTLFVADLHLGKAAAFRALGAPAPTGASEETLRRLAVLVDALEPVRLCVLGDVVHAPASLTPGLGASLAAWRERRGAMECVAVLGNHDRRAGGWLAGCGFRIVEEGGDVDSFACRHYPLAPEEARLPGQIALAGHLHPVTRISGRAYDSLRLPCFVACGRQIVLPAFGEFTGGAPVRREDADRLYVSSGQRVAALA